MSATSSVMKRQRSPPSSNTKDDTCFSPSHVCGRAQEALGTEEVGTQVTDTWVDTFCLPKPGSGFWNPEPSCQGCLCSVWVVRKMSTTADVGNVVEVVAKVCSRRVEIDPEETGRRIGLLPASWDLGEEKYGRVNIRNNQASSKSVVQRSQAANVDHMHPTSSSRPVGSESKVARKQTRPSGSRNTNPFLNRHIGLHPRAQQFGKPRAGRPGHRGQGCVHAAISVSSHDLTV